MIKNALIKSTMLGREDHGFLTFLIDLQIENCYYISIGGYLLEETNPSNGEKIFSSKGICAISGIIDVVGASSWEDLPGKYLRVEDNKYGKITKIGNITDDRWIDLKDIFNA